MGPDAGRARRSSSSRSGSFASGTSSRCSGGASSSSGRAIRGADVKDIAWLDPSGSEMTDEAGTPAFVRCLGVRLAGDAIDEVDERGQPVVGDTLLVLLNAHHDADRLHAAGEDPDERWERLLDTSDAEAPTRSPEGGPSTLPVGRSVALFRLVQVVPHRRSQVGRGDDEGARRSSPRSRRRRGPRPKPPSPRRRPGHTVPNVPGPVVRPPDPEPVAAGEPASARSATARSPPDVTARR